MQKMQDEKCIQFASVKATSVKSSDVKLARSSRLESGVNRSCSAWKPVASRTSQVSVLGPVLFDIFINDMKDDGVCRLRGSVNMLKGRTAIQRDLDRLEK